MMRTLVIADWYLLVRVFTPVTHWIDWRFHRSPYQQARFVIDLAQVMQILGVLATFKARIWWITPMMVLVSIFLHFTIFRDYRRRLEGCQRQFERRPDMICHDQAYFMMLIVPPLRLLQVIMGVLLMVPLMVVDIVQGGGWGGLMNSWVWMVGVMQYIAGVPPPLRPRKRKEERAPAGVLPMPAPAA